MIYKCKYCDESFLKYQKLGAHTLWCNYNPKKEEIKKNIRQKTKNNSIGRKLSQETKNKISISRKLYLKNNPEKHPWKNPNKFISKPCNYLKNELSKKGIEFIEEFQPLLEKNKFYSIDIAFPDIKIGIEINGNQHYNNEGILNEYYQKRHDEIQKEGWKLFQIHYSLAYNIDKILNIINLKEQEIDYSFYIKKIKQKKKKNTREEHFIFVRNKILENETENIEKVKTSKINFSKLGWVTEVAKLINKSHQKVKPWMKKYLPEFYEEKCFKRKSFIGS